MSCLSGPRTHGSPVIASPAEAWSRAALVAMSLASVASFSVTSTPWACWILRSCENEMSLRSLLATLPRFRLACASPVLKGSESLWSGPKSSDRKAGERAHSRLDGSAEVVLGSGRGLLLMISWVEYQQMWRGAEGLQTDHDGEGVDRRLRN